MWLRPIPPDGFFAAGGRMNKEYREAIQVTKEIVIKFIETQRISPANFPEMFPAIYKVVQRTIAETAGDASEESKVRRL